MAEPHPLNAQSVPGGNLGGLSSPSVAAGSTAVAGNPSGRLIVLALGAGVVAAIHSWLPGEALVENDELLAE